MKQAEEDLIFHYELGKAISSWAVIERMLIGIATTCVHKSAERSLLASFYSIENFRSKLAFVDSFIRTNHSDKTTLDHWARVHNDLTRCAKARNSLAHRALFKFADEHSHPGRRVALLEPSEIERSERSASPPTFTKPPPGALCLRDIAITNDEFRILNYAMLLFWRNLLGRPTRAAKSDELARSPQTIRQLRNRTRAALELPPLPSRKKSRAPGNDAPA